MMQAALWKVISCDTYFCRNKIHNTPLADVNQAKLARSFLTKIGCGRLLFYRLTMWIGSKGTDKTTDKIDNLTISEFMIYDYIRT